jgi:hypothetical protein
MLQPDHIALALTEGAAPTGPLEEGLAALLSDKPAPADVIYARDIYEDPYKSEVLEAFLLAEATPEQIADVVRVPAPVTVAYKHLFFDRNVFKDELDVESYVQGYPDDTKEHKWGKELKSCALVLGLEYLTFRFSHKEAEIDLAGSLKNIVSGSYMLAKAARINPLDSNSSREARQWAATAMKAVEIYARVRPVMEDTTDEFAVALESIERATNEAKSGIKRDEIVH